MADALAGFAQGMMEGMRDGENRKFRQMELDARMKSDEEQKSRQRYMDKFEMRKAGFKVPEGDVTQIDPAHLEIDQEYMRTKAASDPMSMALKTLQLRSGMAELENKNRPTEGESTSANFASRMQNAENDFSNLMSQGFDPANWKTAANEAMPEGGILGKLAESAKDPKVKLYQQAKRNFVSAVLRKESGAAISPKEYAEEEKKYFPQPGDTPEVLAQKAAARNQAISNFKVMGGRATGLMGSGMMKDGRMPAAPKMDAEDSAAKAWAEKNPNDQRSKSILTNLKAKYGI